MTVWVVSRHPGALDWLRRRLDLTSARVVADVDAVGARLACFYAEARPEYDPVIG